MKAIVHYTRSFALTGSFVLACLTLSCTKEPFTKPTPKPDPSASELKLQKITSGKQNVEQYTYTDQGQLKALHSEWEYSDSARTRVILDAALAYDAQQRISQITYNGSLSVKFYYEGKLFDKTEEYDHLHRLVVTHLYLFNADNQLVELLDQIHNPNDESAGQVEYVKHRYEYDGKINVQRVYSFTRRTGDAAFIPWQTISYEGYDTKRIRICSWFIILLSLKPVRR